MFISLVYLIFMVYKRRAIVSCKDDEWDILMNDIEWSLFLHLLLPLLESEVTCERFPYERVVVRTKFIFLFSTFCFHLPLPLRNRHHQKLCNHQSYARVLGFAFRFQKTTVNLASNQHTLRLQSYINCWIIQVLYPECLRFRFSHSYINCWKNPH